MIAPTRTRRFNPIVRRFRPGTWQPVLMPKRRPQWLTLTLQALTFCRRLLLRGNPLTHQGRQTMHLYVIEISGDAAQLHPAVAAVADRISDSMHAFGYEGRAHIHMSAPIAAFQTDRPLTVHQLLDIQRTVAPELPGTGAWVIHVRHVGKVIKPAEAQA